MYKNANKNWIELTNWTGVIWIDETGLVSILIVFIAIKKVLENASVTSSSNFSEFHAIKQFFIKLKKKKW